MRRSLNEIETLLRKAAIGARLPVGLAEDMASAGRWLAMNRLDGLGACLHAIEGYSGIPEMRDATPDTILFPDAAIAGAGPSALDFLLCEQGKKAVCLTDMDAPLLMVGLTGAVATDNDLEIEVAFSEGPTLRLSGAGLQGQVPTRWPNSATLRLIGPCDDPLAFRAETGGLDVDEPAYQALAGLALKTMVPESRDSLLAGAGAGLTDND